MKWSWKLGEVAGIGVHIHATFLLLIAWAALVHWMEGRSLAVVLEGIGFILALFACVLLHELGHALTAKRYGIKTRDITLLPIGGMARLERIPDDPRQEVWVTLAGSAVNVVIALALFGWLQFTGGLEPLNKLSVTGGSFLMRLMTVNVFLVLFNMLPAFPMDGGRVLRALLAMRMEYTKATQIAAYLGQGLAFLFGFIGLLTNPFLLFIALFVWIGAAQEASLAQIRSALGGIPVARAMVTDFRTLTPRDSLARAVALVLTGAQQDFPVVEDRRVLGVLTRGDLLIGLARRGQETPVVDVMRREFQTVDSSETLETAFARLQTCECHTLPVVHSGQLVGLITMDNVGEFVAIQAALVQRRAEG
ncbi:MAG: site-2 protease family protein [Deltaproteobacteria bacterium]|nr:site-2 protease family protein [Deltaproteobacteria bacterium]